MSSNGRTPQVYAYLGAPETENIRTRDGQPPGPHAPAILVTPIQNSKMSNAELLQESIVVGDFGQPYIVASPPSSYKPGTVLNYRPPEARFEGRVGFEADIWHSSESFMGSDVDILRQTVETLGRLPVPWWDAFKQRPLWFKEDGQPKSAQDQGRAGLILKAYKSSIRAKLRDISKQNDPPFEDEESR